MDSRWRRRAAVLVLLGSASLHAQSSALTQTGEWTIGGASASVYALESSGRATDPDGATISIRPTTGTPGGGAITVSSRAAADSVRGRRVTIAGELRTSASGGASLWLRVDRGTSMLILENGLDRALRGDMDWTPFAVTLPVPSTATTLVFGVLLQGGGSVTARRVRLTSGPAIASDAPITADAQAVLDAAIKLVRTRAWKRDEVDWPTVEPEVRALASGAEKSADVYPAIRYLLAALGDRHSFLMPPVQTKAFQTGGAQNPSPDVRALPSRAGYIAIPGYSGGDPAAARAYATRLHESITSVVSSVACGWIVDLRTNTGGNMWPMLAGLKPFLGSGPVGSFQSPAGRGMSWVAGQAVGVEPPPALNVLLDAWVAVLTGPRTASSGEAVAIAFRGRPRARAFGLPTAGLSTANSTLPLPDGAMILLTESVDADRTGRQYGDRVDPDETVAAGTAPPSFDDATVEAAIRWLRASTGCGRPTTRRAPSPS